MKLAMLELFKKTGDLIISSRRRESLEEVCKYSIIGYYDLLRIKRPNSCEALFSNKVDQDSLATCYSSYTLKLFEILDEAGGTEDLIEEMDKGTGEPDYYIVISCVLRKGFYGYASGTAALKAAKAKICKLLSDLKAGTAEKEFFKDKKTSFQVMGNLGMFDIAVIVRSKDLHALVKLPIELRLNGIDWVTHSSSFITFKPEDFKTAKSDAFLECQKEPNLSMDIRFATYDARNDYELSYKLEQYIKRKRVTKNADVKPHSTVGEYGLSIRVSNITARGVASIMRSPFLDIYNNRHKKYLKTTYNLVLEEYEKDSISEDLKDFDLENLNELKHIDKEMNSRLKATSKFIEKITDEYSGIDIPKHIEHTLNVCVSAVFALLRDNLKYKIGQDLARILLHVLKTARESQWLCRAQREPYARGVFLSEWHDQFVKVISEISITLPNLQPANNFLMDSQEKQDDVNSVIKALIANQWFVKDFYQLVNRQDNKDPFEHIFITVGATKDILTSRHSFPMPKPSQNFLEESSWSRPIVSFNVPDVRYLRLNECLPMMVHDLAHFHEIVVESLEGRTENWRTERNRALLLVIKSFIEACVTVLKFPPLQPGLSMEKEQREEMRKFTIEVNEEIKSMLETGMKRKKIRMKKLLASRNSDFLDCIDKILREISDKGPMMPELRDAFNFTREYISSINDACKEARSDAIMIYMCGLDEDSYFSALSRYFDDRKHEPPYNDAEFGYRLATVFGYFFSKYRHENGFDIDEFSNSDLDEWWHKLMWAKQPLLTGSSRQFIRKYGDYVYSKIGIVLPFSNYLVRLVQKNDENIRAIEKDLKKVDCNLEWTNLWRNAFPKGARKQLSVEDEIKFYIDGWYECRKDKPTQKRG